MRIEAAPAVVVLYDSFFITNRLFNSKEQAADSLDNFNYKKVIWPCPFDKERGVWYWEAEG